jgi:hypothetical protein
MRRYLVPTIIGSVLGVIIAPVVAPTLGRLLRPVARGTIKAGVSVYNRGRVLSAELAENVEDMVAEAQHDLRQPDTEI